MPFKRIIFILLPIVILLCCKGYGQTITGTVIDKITQQPLSGCLVTSGTLKTYTDMLGRFEIAVPVLDDSLKVSRFTYKTYTCPANKYVTSLLIELEPATISLNTVTIHGDRDFKKDSIANRLAYAKQFNYKGPSVMDAFTGNSSPTRQYGELLSVNLLTLVEALTKKSTPEYKFNKVLIRDERAEYVERKFDSGNTARITGLNGDSLSAFITRYRPTYDFAKKATDYDMELYIKSSFKQFKKDRIMETDPFKRP